MRALPLLLSGALMAVGMTAAPATVPARTNAAFALVPLAHALGAASASASVEVYATEILPGAAPIPALEDGLLPGARWTASRLGDGSVYQGGRGAVQARISEIPLPHGRRLLTCSRTETVAPSKIAAALEDLWGTPCGTDQSSVMLTARLHSHPTAQQISQAIRSTGAKPMGVLAGPTGGFALADLPGGAPEVSVGGRSMNLALRISYDRAHNGSVLIGAPNLRPRR